MRFLCVYRAEEGGLPNPQMIEDMGKLIGEMTAAGVLLSTEGCQSTAKGARVRRTNGKVTVVDGPFTEAKEVIGGFALIQEEALEWTKRFLEVAGDGESEIRLLHEAPVSVA